MDPPIRLYGQSGYFASGFPVKIQFDLISVIVSVEKYVHSPYLMKEMFVY
jgi:hypothetical protein